MGILKGFRYLFLENTNHKATTTEKSQKISKNQVKRRENRFIHTPTAKDHDIGSYPQWSHHDYVGVNM
jgi:hypothetical protein